MSRNQSLRCDVGLDLFSKPRYSITGLAAMDHMSPFLEILNSVRLEKMSRIRSHRVCMLATTTGSYRVAVWFGCTHTQQRFPNKEVSGSENTHINEISVPSTFWRHEKWWSQQNVVL